MLAELKNLKLLVFAISTMVIMLLLSGTEAFAVHKGAGALVCGACHTMHNSQGGAVLQGVPDGSLVLLRGNVTSRNETHRLCLQCHADNGAQANVLQPPANVKAPKVFSSASWQYPTSNFGQIGAGGNFYPELNTNWDTTTPDYLGKGHSVGATDVTPPGGDASIAEFTCTNCHDPHGTDDPNDPNINIFRNLRVNPIGAGNNSGVKFIVDPANPYRENHSYVGGVSKFPPGTASNNPQAGYFGGNELDAAGNVIWPVYKGSLTGVPATDGPNSNSYASGQDVLGGGVTISRWCAQCHDDWHEGLNSGNVLRDGAQADFRFWKRHPVNIMIPRAASKDCADGCHVSMLDRSNYSYTIIQSGLGVPVTTSNKYTAGDGYVYYLPWETTGDGIRNMDSPATGGFTHKVFCLSCHFVHGGPNYDNLRWDYTSSVGIGSQAGNAIPNSVGCQLCHNR